MVTPAPGTAPALTVPGNVHRHALAGRTRLQRTQRTDHRGPSTLGAAAVAMHARVLVSALDDGPGIRRGCDALSVDYAARDR